MHKKDLNRAKTTEELAEAARESYKAAVDWAFAVQENSTRLSRSFFEDWIDKLEAQTKLNRRTLQDLAALTREQREAFQELSRGALNAYDDFLDSFSDSTKR